MKMKNFILMLSLFLSSEFCFSQNIVYEHIGKRWRFFGENNYMMITGERRGLLLQMPSEEAGIMPFEVSTVVMPDGEVKPLKFKMIKDLPGFWQCTFTEDHDSPLKGLYKYKIKLKKNQKEILHLIRCSVAEGDPLHEVIIQKEVIQPDQKSEKSNSQKKSR